MNLRRIAYIVIRCPYIDAMNAVQPSVTIIVKGYPRLSETFIAQEIHALEARGLDLNIASLRRPTDPAFHPLHNEISAPVLYLPEYLYLDPLRLLRAWRLCRRKERYNSALKSWLADLSRDPTPNRVRRFGQALVLAAELPDHCGFLYAHFLHTPASVARYTSMITGLPWACSAHAKDIWTTPDWEIKQKLDECEWLVSCTNAAVQHLQLLSPDPGKISLVYHGLDFNRFAEPSGWPRNRTPGTGKTGTLCILSIGRAVEKKGFDDLLHALASLPRSLDWRLVHIGGGSLAERLKKNAQELGLSRKIEWRGAQSHDDVLCAYRSADIFVLPSRVADDGDRDGLPNVLLEAQSQKVPCISTRISGIPELIEDGVTGILVEQQDPAALARAIELLLASSESRARLGQAGFDRVRARFSLLSGMEKLIQQFPKRVLPGGDRILRTA